MKRGIINMEHEVVVSVLMLAYNHERYIKKALESVLNQKTNFKFEILIHDDASPDGTADIIREYENKYPDIIKPVYQTENQYSKGVKIQKTYLYPRVIGKYVAFMECDDYWTDENKLQKQVDFLESHPEIFSVAHKNMIVDKDDNCIGYSHKNMELDRYFDKKDAMKYMGGIFHPASIMYRSWLVRSEHYLKGSDKCCIIEGHVFSIFYFASLSNIYVMNDCMSAWRCVIEAESTSYSSRYLQHRITYGNKMLNAFCQYRELFGNIYNFNKIISKTFCRQIIWLIFAKEDNVNKRAEFKKILHIVKLTDCFNVTVIPEVIFDIIRWSFRRLWKKKI